MQWVRAYKMSNKQRQEKIENDKLVESITNKMRKDTSTNIGEMHQLFLKLKK